MIFLILFSLFLSYECSQIRDDASKQASHAVLDIRSSRGDRSPFLLPTVGWSPSAYALAF